MAKSQQFGIAFVTILIFFHVFCLEPKDHSFHASVADALHTRATIFASGSTATVERTLLFKSSISKSNKMYSLVIDHLSRHIQQDSVLLKMEFEKQFEDKVGVTILDYSVRTRQLGEEKQSPTSAQQQLKKQKEDLENKRQVQLLHRNRIKTANALLEKSIQEVASKGNLIEDRLESFLKHLEINDGKIVELDKEIKELDLQISFIGNQLLTQQNQVLSEITIHVAIDSDSDLPEFPFQLHLSYQVTNVNWSPFYTLKVDSSKSQGVLEFGAIIAQQTEEDWNNAQITLSTAKPSNAGAPPVVHPTHVSIHQQYKPQYDAFVSHQSIRKGPVSMMTPQFQNQNYQKEMEIGLSAEAPLFTVSDSIGVGRITSSDVTNIVNYEINQPLNIPSNIMGQSQKATIATIELKHAVFEHVTYPSQSQQVYMKLKAKNTSNMPLLNGMMNIMIDQQLVSKSQLMSGSYSAQSTTGEHDTPTQTEKTAQPLDSMIMPGGSFEVFVGTDKSISVTIEPWNQKQEEIGSSLMFNKRNMMSKSRSLVIHNKKSIQINMTVVESIPLVDQPDQIRLFLMQPLLQFKDKSTDTTSLPTFMREYVQSIDDETKRASAVFSTCIKQKADDASADGEDTCRGEYPKVGTRVSVNKEQIMKRVFSVPSKQVRTLVTQYAVEFPSNQQIHFHQQ